MENNNCVKIKNGSEIELCCTIHNTSKSDVGTRIKNFGISASLPESRLSCATTKTTCILVYVIIVIANGMHAIVPLYMTFRVHWHCASGVLHGMKHSRCTMPVFMLVSGHACQCLHD